MVGVVVAATVWVGAGVVTVVRVGVFWRKWGWGCW